MQQQGDCHYGLLPPEIATARHPLQIGISADGDHVQQRKLLAEASSPVSIWPPPLSQPVVDCTMLGSFAEEEALETGEEAARRKDSANRWPRQETLALLNIRSEMDATFRDSALKGPLWDDVSRKLAELGYTRSAKKCKEKLENMHKYYKRTKEGHTGRQDGKSYRFFSQLEALQNTSAAATPPMVGSSSAALQSAPYYPPLPPPTPIAEPSWPAQETNLNAGLPEATTAGTISFSGNISLSSASETDGEDAGAASLMEGRKRKREGWPCKSTKAMAFFEGLLEQVMKQQEAMQQRLLETMEKREQNRIMMEESWKRKEMARLNREYELRAQERAVTATRDAAVISFLQKLAAGQPMQSPTTPASPPQEKQQMQETIQQNPKSTAQVLEIAEAIGGGGFDATSPASSRWPKSEVHALIKIRSWLEEKYQEAGPKGPLWEEISLEMQRLGYNRSSKRCKEKWENINKYYKKVKESKKKRPEDAKTCPYFHQLEALHRKKQLRSSIEESALALPPEAEQ